MRKALVLAACVACMTTTQAWAIPDHQGGYYWAKADAQDYFNRNPLRPYGAYDGMTIHVRATYCTGVVRQVGPETTPPTLHQGALTLYKHFFCAAYDQAGHEWSWLAHGLASKMAFSRLTCVQRYSHRPCPVGG